MNEIAVKVPSVFKLLIKEVMLNVVYKKKQKLDFLMSFKDSIGPIFKVPLWMENLKTNLINSWLQFINNFYLSIITDTRRDSIDRLVQTLRASF